MHAEDEFTAGSYGSAKRDAVRVLQGTFPVRVVVEGATSEEVEPLVKLIDRQVALGALGHLPVGGHKTRGAGSGHWQAKPWVNDDVVKSSRTWVQPKEPEEQTSSVSRSTRTFLDRPDAIDVSVRTKTGEVADMLTLGEAAKLAKTSLGNSFVAWWCDPTIDLDLHTPPATFGNAWPSEDDKLQVDEVAFFAERAVWRAVRTSNGPRFVLIEELTSKADDAKEARVVHTPAPARLPAFLFGKHRPGQRAPARVARRR